MKCYTATISCGYTLAESSHYATKEWLPLGVDVAKILNKSREEELFSMEELLCNIVEDAHSSQEILQPALTEFEKIVDRELSFRKVLYEIGLKSSKRMAIATPPPRSTPGSGRRNSTDLDESITRCEISKKICFLSLVLNEAEDLALSMEQALIHLQKKKNLKTCKLLFRHTEVRRTVKIFI
ncbi:hypothetical protein FSP39_000783 [Pinctada imbricata]|uniref:Uncharacterized protein n=1 Tax=Pinctada imbricata TaxID=66713 RepID=A0AA89BJY8_PINIB|nr:hypothetical protein FSP39_000783 [Pinctada imbricata]